MFKRAYLEAWKARDTLPKDVYFKGELEYQREHYAYYYPDSDRTGYKVFSLVDGNVVLLEHVPDYKRPRQPLTDEQRAEYRRRVEAFAERLGHPPSPKPLTLLPGPNAEAPALPQVTYCTCSGAMMGGACICQG